MGNSLAIISNCPCIVLVSLKYTIHPNHKSEGSNMSFSSVSWNIFGSEREYPTYKWMELARSADFLCRTILDIKSGENIVIYADSATDPRVVQATAAAIHTIGAHPVVVWYETRGDIDLPPPKPVEAAVLAADLVIEYAVAYLVHSQMWRKAIDAGVPMTCLTGMNADMMIRCINPDLDEKMRNFGQAYREVVARGKEKGRVTNTAGTDITYKVRPTRVISSPPGRTRGHWMGLGGQGGLNEVLETINGTIAFDGAIWPPSEIGAIKQPIKLKVVDGVVKEITGGFEAGILKNWFAHFNDPRSYKINHISTGFNPGVKRITGDILEDERVFGCVEIGIGSTEVPSHTDGVILNPSIWVDDELIEDNGIFIEPTLKKLAKELGMQLWVE